MKNSQPAAHLSAADTETARAREIYIYIYFLCMYTSELYHSIWTPLPLPPSTMAALTRAGVITFCRYGSIRARLANPIRNKERSGASGRNRRRGAARRRRSAAAGISQSSNLNPERKLDYGRPAGRPAYLAAQCAPLCLHCLCLTGAFRRAQASAAAADVIVSAIAFA